MALCNCNALNDNLVLLWIYAKYLAALTLVLTSEDLDLVALLDLHLRHVVPP